MLLINGSDYLCEETGNRKPGCEVAAPGKVFNSGTSSCTFVFLSRPVAAFSLSEGQNSQWTCLPVAPYRMKLNGSYVSLIGHVKCKIKDTTYLLVLC
jgi:hypothetical protein